MSAPLVLAVDGGNSKTDLALVRGDGELLALVRGPQSSPDHLGVDGSLAVLEELLRQALTEAGLPNGAGPAAEIGKLYLAGVDVPSEEEAMRVAATRHKLARRISVGNDTFAVLRAGTDSGWGVAVVCGAGINCRAVSPDGRQARFPAMGWISGDWGGGWDVGHDAVSAAARSEDGRGQKTTLEQAVPAYFGLSTPTELAEAFHHGEISERRVMELPPVVIAEAARDETAAAIVAHLAAEIVTLIRVALERLGLTGEAVEVALGGGLMQPGYVRLIGAIVEGVREIAPAATLHVTSSPPVVGAALLGLDEIGANPDAQQRVRKELAEAFKANETPGRRG